MQFVAVGNAQVIVVYPLFFGTQVFYYYFGFFGIVPKVRSKSFFFFVGDFNQFGINVKDTSSTHQGAPQYLLFVRYLS